MESTAKKLIVFLSLLAVSHLANAQFEQKFTLQVAGGYVHAISPESFSEVFTDGFSLDAGAQYNFNRSTSLVVLAKYSTFFATDFIVEANYNLIGISICPKHKLISTGRVHPYVFGGVSINYYSFTLPLSSGESAFKTPWEIRPGFTGGVGIDLSITDNLGLFWQGGLGGVAADDMQLSIYTQFGINISMFKARTL